MEATDYIDAAEAAKLLPGRPSANSVWRWMSYGKMVKGRRIKLRSCPGAKGKLYTKPIWTAEYVNACADAMQAQPEAAPAAPAQRIGRRDRSKKIAVAMRELGIG